MEKILVHSYKGGTGKTTIALNIAALLSVDNKVLLIENDFMMPSFFAIFDQEPHLYFNDYLNRKTKFNEIIISEIRPNLDVVFTNKNFDPNEEVMGSDQAWFLSTLDLMIKDLSALETKYDYVIFDTPPGWHMIVINLIILSNKALLILRPNSYAINGTKRMLDILYKRAKPLGSWDVFILFNQIPEVDMQDDLDKWSEEFKKEGIKCAGEISCSCEISYQMAHEAMIFPRDHEFNKTLDLALKRIL